MRSLTIEASSEESARRLHQAMSVFQPEVAQTGPGRYEVRVALAAGGADIVAVLNALEAYVCGRGADPARVELDGHAYTLHPTDAAP